MFTNFQATQNQESITNLSNDRNKIQAGTNGQNLTMMKFNIDF